MKRACLLLLLLFSLFAFSATGTPQKKYRVKEVPNVQLRDRAQFVSDPDEYLSPLDRERINKRLYHLRATYGAEVAVVVLPYIDDAVYASAREFAVELFNDWKLGRRSEDNGLLILEIVEGREIIFETGYGLEGVLPDALTKRIQLHYMVPLLKEGQIGEALYAGVVEVEKVLTGESTLSPFHIEGLPREQVIQQVNIPWREILSLWVFLGLGYFTYVFFTLLSLRRKSDWYSHMKAKELFVQAFWVNLIFFIWFLPIWGLFYLLGYRALMPKVLCSSCHTKGQFIRVSTPIRVRSVSYDDKEMFQASYRCKQCGNVERVKYNYQPFSFLLLLLLVLRALASTSFRGGMGGGHGGSSGGSWGGGSSGGGGSSTRY